MNDEAKEQILRDLQDLKWILVARRESLIKPIVKLDAKLAKVKRQIHELRRRSGQ